MHLQNADIKSRKKQRRQQFLGSKMLGQVTKLLKGCFTTPMTALRRPQDMGPGELKGSLATHPRERDAILHMAWDPTTRENVDDATQAKQEFCAKYDKYIPTNAQMEIGKLTLESFKRTCKAGQKTAAGLDGWSAADLSILSDMAYGAPGRLPQCH